MEQYEAIAFGCPSMGAEELEDSEFLPMFERCEKKLEGKKIALSNRCRTKNEKKLSRFI